MTKMLTNVSVNDFMRHSGRRQQHRQSYHFTVLGFTECGKTDIGGRGLSQKMRSKALWRVGQEVYSQTRRSDFSVERTSRLTPGIVVKHSVFESEGNDKMRGVDNGKVDGEFPFSDSLGALNRWSCDELCAFDQSQYVCALCRSRF
jgi:hypothetical protein